MTKLSDDLADLLYAQASKLNSDNVAVLLSGGVDSQSVLFSLLKALKNVVVYSFTLDDRESTDYVLAKNLATRLSLPFKKIELKTDLDILKTKLKVLAKLGAKSKTDFECFYPMLFAYDKIKEPVIASGLGADGHFCLSKKGMIHYKNRIDEFRNELFGKENYAQLNLHKTMAQKLNKTLWFPYLSSDIKNLFLGTSWDEINKPKQKQVIRDAFKNEFNLYQKPRNHVNFQKGDSGISELFELLLTSDWNLHGYKSVTGIFNSLLRGEV